MDLIQRPKKVERSQKSYLTNEKYQDYAETQFKNIYDYFDGSKEEIDAMSEEISNTVISTSNTNGTAVKFSNGVMICYKTVNLSNVSISTARGSIYVSNSLSLGNFPEEFIDIPVVNLTLEASASRGWIDWYNGKSKTSAGLIYLARATSDTGLSFTVNIIAIGKYK